MPEVTQLLSQEMGLELQLQRLSPKLMFVITVPVSDLIRPGVLQREKKKKKIKAIHFHQRLSTTFLFREGSES